MNPQKENDSENLGRAGRPLGIRGIRVLASRHSHDCLKVLVDVANNAKAPDADRVRAAETVLAYAASKPGGDRP
jgi:hypothetical protein